MQISNTNNKLLPANEVAKILGVSSATVRNWIKTGHIKPVADGSFFQLAEIHNFKDQIDNGFVDKLSSRANKRNSSTTFIPDEYITNDRHLNSVNQIIALHHSQNNSIGQTLFAVALNLLLNEGLIETQGITYLSEINSKHEYIKAEILDWAGHLNLSDDYTASISQIVQTKISFSDDFLGLLYQSLSLEGDKAQKGSYYTPKDLVDEITKDYVKPESIVLDPCCGTGQFLMSSAETIETPENIWGFDIDEIAVRIAKINLFLSYPNHIFKPNIYNRNTLLGLDIDSLFSDLNIPKFDLVITNPPWGAHFSLSDVKALQAKYPRIKSKESFSYFIDKSRNLLKDGGILSFILPESILNVRTHQDIREILVKETKIKKICYLDRVFKNVFSPVIRLDFEKNIPPKNHKIIAEKDGTTHKADQLSFANNSGIILNIFMNENDNLLFSKLYSKEHTTLKNNADWALGIVTGNNKEHVKHGQSNKTEPIATGKDVKRFVLKPAEKFIDFKPQIFQQVAPEVFYRSNEKLIYKFISKQLVFAYDNKQTLTLNSANILIPKLDNYPIKTILALFNSSPYQFIYQKKFNAIKALKSNIEELPIPKLDKAEHKKIEKLVDHLLNLSLPYEKRQQKYIELDRYIMSLFELEKHEEQHILEAISNPDSLLKLT